MGSATKLKDKETLNKRMTLKERFTNPEEIMLMMSDYMKEGDVASITDLISSYISNSNKYPNQEAFAESIGTTRQTLHRMLSHNDNVSIKVFFKAIEKIYEDVQR